MGARSAPASIHWLLLAGGLGCLTIPATRLAAVPTAEQLEFFEKRIRPVLAGECYECHAGKKLKGGLALDSRDGLLKGGESGPALTPGNPNKSLLIRSIRHTHKDLKMPKDGAKLDGAVIQDFVTWVKMGAPDPRDKPPAAVSGDPAVAWPSTLASRKEWWSFQPVKKSAVPTPKNNRWSTNSVDRFLLAKMEPHGLKPSSDASPRVLIRRLSFALTGLPPTPAEVEDFLRDYPTSPPAFEAGQKVVGAAVERLLASPAFGERWARHWMDLVRFAETHGSEGDPDLPLAWRYRDYLIRAFNSDVPLDQLIREHLAGDLLPNPRWNKAEQFNESMLGTAHLRMVEHGYQAVDTLDDQVKVVENQIDVLGKAFQGLTIACARCHDHKFDPISQRDFYALYGIFASCRPSMVTIDAPERLRVHREEMENVKEKIKVGLAQAWTDAAAGISAQLLKTVPGYTGNPASAPDEVMHDRIANLERQLVQLERTALANALRHRGNPEPGAPLPLPMAAWNFEGNAADLVGELHGELLGGATVKNGRLILDGKGAFVRTPPLPRELREKTLEVWVALANRDQRGGGVLTVQTLDGGVFDSVVFGEKEPGKWIAGSDGFRRTEIVNGPVETVQPGEMVHLAIVYRADHSITLYRNGVAYGSSYRPAGDPATFRTFAAGASQILFGLRHLGAGDGFLNGEIDEARLYDRPLTSAEVMASFKAGTTSLAPGEDGKLLNSEQRAEQVRRREELKRLRAEFATRFPDYALKEKARERMTTALAQAEQDPGHPLHPWVKLRGKTGAELTRGWENLLSESQDDLAARRKFNAEKFHGGWNLAAGDDSSWFKPGVNPPERSAHAGEFVLEPEGERIVSGIYPAGVYSHRLSQKHNGLLTSPRFKVETDHISIRALGGQGARVRLIVDNYPLGSGGIFPQAALTANSAGWIRLDTAYRKGSWAYLEFATAEDVVSRDRPAAGSGGRSYFGAQQVLFHDAKASPKPEILPVLALFQNEAPASPEELAACLGQGIVHSVNAWLAGEMSEEQQALLDALLASGLLPNTTNELRELAPRVVSYRKLEAEIPVARRAPGVLETLAYNAEIMPRGDHTKHGDVVPRRFLEVFASQPYQTKLSGRLELANEIADAHNPLTARVLVNRIWQHLFGRGLVPTVDNFGRMGEKPTHPELLDYLAARFVEEGWSLKQLIRELVSTRAYQMGSEASPRALETDAANEWLSHFRVQRLEAEAIRDSLLAVSGKLDRAMFGAGAGDANAPRRSIYLTVRRTSLNPFLDIFDAPKPFTTLGRRDATNVPAQSLALLNDPFVIDLAQYWSASLVARPPDVDDRLRLMFNTTLARPPSPEELLRSKKYLTELAQDQKITPEQILANALVWQDFAQSLFNLKELIYVR